MRATLSNESYSGERRLPTPFKCPVCGEELERIGYSVAWSLGGAEKLRCHKCNRYLWWIWPDIERHGNSFYLEAKDGVDPYEYCREKGLLNPKYYQQNRPTTLTDFLECSEEVRAR